LFNRPHRTFGIYLINAARINFVVNEHRLAFLMIILSALSQIDALRRKRCLPYLAGAL
jgi:hypothetical protein